MGTNFRIIIPPMWFSTFELILLVIHSSHTFIQYVHFYNRSTIGIVLLKWINFNSLWAYQTKVGFKAAILKHGSWIGLVLHRSLSITPCSSILVFFLWSSFYTFYSFKDKFCHSFGTQNYKSVPTLKNINVCMLPKSAEKDAICNLSKSL